MTRPRVCDAAILCTVLCIPLLSAADFSSYRGFQFGASLAAAAKHAGMNPSEAKLVHSQPAMIQELEWRPESAYLMDAARVDPIREARLRFYNGELFQIISSYDRQKVEGMTETDMVQAISLTYGPAVKPAAEIPYRTYYAETAFVVARWENPEYSYSLIRDQVDFVLILSLKRLDILAQPAIVEAARLEALQAPQRAIALLEKQEEANRIVREKARSVNMRNFRP